MGCRFQTKADSDYNEVIFHIRLNDSEAMLQQESIGDGYQPYLRLLQLPPRSKIISYDYCTTTFLETMWNWI